MDVTLVGSCSQFMHCSVLVLEKQVTFHAIFIYTFNSSAERFPLWEDIISISRSASLTPWILLGDFNVVHFLSERMGGDLSWLSYMEDLNQCYFESQLDDLKFSGHFCTWSYKSPGDFLITRKLDRALVNPIWGTTFPGSETVFHPPGVSDHCPIAISISLELHIHKSPFKFFNFWADHEEFEHAVASSWSTPIHGYPLFQVCQKLKLVKANLKELNAIHFRDLPK